MASESSSEKHVMLSGRFNKPEIKIYMEAVKEFLNQSGVKTYMVDCAPGEDFSEQTMWGLYNAWAMVVFGTSEYGAKTGAQYETYWELKYAHQNSLFLVPIQLCEAWPPEPTDHDGGKAGAAQNRFVLMNTIVRSVDKTMDDPQRVASEIANKLLQGTRGHGYGRDSQDPAMQVLQAPPHLEAQAREADTYNMTLVAFKNQKHGEFLYANEPHHSADRRHVLTWGGNAKTPLESPMMRFKLVDFGDYLGFQSELYQEWMYVGEPQWNSDRRYVLTWGRSGSPKTDVSFRFKIEYFDGYVGIKGLRFNQWVYANDPKWNRDRRYVLSWRPDRGHPTTNPDFRWELKELSPPSQLKVL